MKEYNGEKYIVSFTSFKERFDNACKMVYSLLNQTYKDFHIVLTVYKGDMKDLSKNMKLLIDNHLLELIEAPEDLGPHLKYYYAMKKYWDKPIITVDDDRFLSRHHIAQLVKKYESLSYKSVISVSAPKMMLMLGKVPSQKYWCTGPRRLRPNEKSYIAMAEGFAGILYPSKCFQNLDDEIPLIKKCIYHDDLYLKALEIRQKIPVTQINGSERTCPVPMIKGTQEFSLNHRRNNDDSAKYRDTIVSLLNSQLVQGFKL